GAGGRTGRWSGGRSCPRRPWSRQQSREDRRRTSGRRVGGALRFLGSYYSHARRTTRSCPRSPSEQRFLTIGIAQLIKNSIPMRFPFQSGIDHLLEKVLTCLVRRPAFRPHEEES